MKTVVLSRLGLGFPYPIYKKQGSWTPYQPVSRSGVSVVGHGSGFHTQRNPLPLEGTRARGEMIYALECARKTCLGESRGHPSGTCLTLSPPTTNVEVRRTKLFNGLVHFHALINKPPNCGGECHWKKGIPCQKGTSRSLNDSGGSSLCQGP